MHPMIMVRNNVDTCRGIELTLCLSNFLECLGFVDIAVVEDKTLQGS